MYKLTCNDGEFYVVHKPRLTDAIEYKVYKLSQGISEKRIIFEFVEIKRNLNVSNMIMSLRHRDETIRIRNRAKRNK